MLPEGGRALSPAEAENRGRTQADGIQAVLLEILEIEVRKVLVEELGGAVQGVRLRGDVLIELMSVSSVRCPYTAAELA